MFKVALENRRFVELSSRFCRVAAAACAATLLLVSAVAGGTADTVRDRLSDARWSARAIDALLAVHAEEFDLDARADYLDQRLEILARLGRYPGVLRIVEEFPKYVDLFVNAAEPDALARVIRELAVDRQDTARLLNLTIGWNSRREIGHLQRVLERHGSTVILFTGSVHLHSLVQALVLAEAERAPRAWSDWLAAELRVQAREDRLEEILAVVETQGRAIARRMESRPGFAGEFPHLWRQFRDLVDGKPTEEGRHESLADLLSHEGVWETLAEPFGATLLRRADDWVPILLLTLWGTEGWTKPLEAAGPLLEQRQPMPPERRAWLLRELASDTQQGRSRGEFGMVLHGSEAFWAIALDPVRSHLLDCALETAWRQSGWDGSGEIPRELLENIERSSSLSARALERICADRPSMIVQALPGYYSVKLIGDLWAGAPVGLGDVVSTGTELYVIARYATLLGRGAMLAHPSALRLGARMSLDHLLTQRVALARGQTNAVAPRVIDGQMRNFVLVENGWLAPVPLAVVKQGGLFLTRETLHNLALEGISASDFPQRVILHFRCAGPNQSEDPRCQ